MKKRMRKIMTKIVLGLLAVIAVICIAVVLAMAETSREFVISGYAICESAIKGEIERQLIRLVKEINANKNVNDQLQIAVMGSADRTGISAENDKLAKDRAEQVAAVLSHHFSEAKINVWSKGDEANIRQVKVEYKIVIPPPPAPVIVQPAPPALAPVPAEASKESRVKKTLGIFGISFAIATIIIAALAIRWVLQRRKPTDVVFTIEVNDLIYKVPVQWDGTWLWSPFKNLKGGGQIREKSKKEMGSSLKGCLKKEVFAPQREELIRSDKIIQATKVKSG